MKTKKPFKYTFIGRMLKSDVLKSALGEGLSFIPVAGPILSNVFTKVKGDGVNEITSPIGKLDTEKASLQLYGLILIATLAAGVSLAMGWLTIGQIKAIIYAFADVFMG